MRYGPVVKVWDFPERSRWFPAPGTVTVTLVPAGYPVAGMNTAAEPVRRHVPAMAGASRGSGAEAGSGWL